MNNIIIEKPYIFVPPYDGWFWPKFLQLFVRRRLRRVFGIQEIECRGLQHLRESLAAGHGVLIAPNHCRPCDPFVISELARQVGEIPYTMASWHLFMQGRLQAWMLRRAGVFSIYREGMDRAALAAATEILVKAHRPLVIFPEGVISRTNDRLNALMEGTALIARSAAKKRAAARPPGQVVVHPVALREKGRRSRDGVREGARGQEAGQCVGQLIPRCNVVEPRSRSDRDWRISGAAAERVRAGRVRAEDG